MGILLSPLLLGFSRPSSRKRSPVQHFLQARVKRIVPAKEASPRRAGGCRCRSLSAADGIAGRAFAAFVDGNHAAFPVLAPFPVVEGGFTSAPLRLTESVAPSLPRWLLPRRMVVKGKSAGRKRGLPPAISAISGTGNELQPMGRLASLNEKGNSYPVPEITVPEITAGSESRYLSATCNQKKSCIPMRHISA